MKSPSKTKFKSRWSHNQNAGTWSKGGVSAAAPTEADDGTFCRSIGARLARKASATAHDNPLCTTQRSRLASQRDQSAASFIVLPRCLQEC